MIEAFLLAFIAGILVVGTVVKILDKEKDLDEIWTVFSIVLLSSVFVGTILYLNASFLSDLFGY